MKILLVDQSEAIRAIEKAILRELGDVRFVEAADGLEALAIFSDAAADPFDLIVIEASLPAISGLELVAKIRETDRTVALAMVTSDAEKARVIEAIKAGVNAYIVKPFTPEMLLGKIRAVLGRKKVA